MGFLDDKDKDISILMGQNVNENKAMTKVVIAINCYRYAHVLYRFPCMNSVHELQDFR